MAHLPATTGHRVHPSRWPGAQEDKGGALAAKPAAGMEPSWRHGGPPSRKLHDVVCRQHDGSPPVPGPCQLSYYDSSSTPSNLPVGKASLFTPGIKETEAQGVQVASSQLHS